MRIRGGGPAFSHRPCPCQATRARRVGHPADLPHKSKCAKRRHAVLALRAAVYERAAAAAGRELGDVEPAASAMLLELMPFDARGWNIWRAAVPEPWLAAPERRAFPFGASAPAGVFRAVDARRRCAAHGGPWPRSVGSKPFGRLRRYAPAWAARIFKLDDRMCLDAAKLARCKYPVAMASRTFV